jgi:NAD(P)-dependent dehydrogenase (short-subunit alcohol dehydrogenase family)
MTLPRHRSDLVAVITGASRGLGAGLAATFAAEGIRLGLCARTRPDQPEGPGVWAASVDVADAESVDRFARDVVERFGRIDIWVNNAGVLEPIGPLATADPAALARHVDINLLGVAHGSASFSRHVRSRPGGGSLVNISSGAATTPYEGWAPYCATKAAVEMLTEVVAMEERVHGLKAYAVAPGVVDTGMQALVRSTPLGDFPAGDRFRRLHREEGLNSPEWVARFIVDRLVGGTAPSETGQSDEGPSDEGPSDAGDGIRLRVPDQRAQT